MDREILRSLSLDHMACDELGFDLVEDALEAAIAHFQEEGAAACPLSRAISQRRARAAPRKQSISISGWGTLAPVLDSAPRDASRKWKAGALARATVAGAEFVRLKQACRRETVSPLPVVLALLLEELAARDGRVSRVVNLPVSNRTNAVERGLIANLSMLLHMPLACAGRTDWRAIKAI